MARMATLTICLLFAMVVSNPVLGAGFAKFSGIDGESTDANHDNWTDILSVSYGYSLLKPDKKKPDDPSVSSIKITKELDKSGVKIAEALLTGNSIDTVEIELTAIYGGARATYFKITLYNVRVTEYFTRASGIDVDGPPIEEIELVYRGVDVAYTEYASDGNSQGNTEYSYDVPH